MARQKLCECGHPEGTHLTFYGHPGLCRPCLGRFTECFVYRPVKRKEPLSAPDRQISERELRKFLSDHIKYAEAIQGVLETERAQGVVSGRLVEARSVLSKFCLEGD